jgi:hypothetical protein
MILWMMRVSVLSKARKGQGLNPHTKEYVMSILKVSVLSKARKGQGPTRKICHVDQGVARLFAFCGVWNFHLTIVQI